MGNRTALKRGWDDALRAWSVSVLRAAARKTRTAGAAAWRLMPKSIAGWAVCVFVGGFLLLIALKMLSLFNVWPRPTMYLRSWRRSLWQVALVDSIPDPLLILLLDDYADGTPGGYTRLVSLSLETGTVHGDQVNTHGYTLAGVNRQSVWLQRRWSRRRELHGYGLPGFRPHHRARSFTRKHEEIARIVDSCSLDGPNGMLRVYARNGYQYRLNLSGNTLTRLPLAPPRPAPNLLRWQDQCGRRSGYLTDDRTCRTMVSGDDIFTKAYIGENGKVEIGRRTPGKPLQWITEEHEMAGEEPHDGKGRFISWSTFHGGRVYVVLCHNEYRGPAYVAALEEGSGAVVWHRTFR